MDEETKSEARGKDPERLGPYRLEEHVEQSHDTQGECLLATNETSGAKALVRKHAAEERKAPEKGWRVILTYWASRGYSDLEVVHTDWARAVDKQTAESLLLTLESVLEEVRRMVHAVYGPPEPRFPWRDVVGAATVGALLLALVLRASVSPAPSTPPAAPRYEVPTETWTSDFRAGLAGTTDAGQSVLTRPLPKEPFKGQKRPPCTRYTEVEMVGACWMPHKLKAPCPEDLFEHQGECYVPSFSAKPPPSSLGQ